MLRRFEKLFLSLVSVAALLCVSGKMPAPLWASSISNGGGGSATVAALFANLHDVTATTASSFDTLMDASPFGSATLPAGYFNSVGKTMLIKGGGTYTTTGTQGTVTFRVAFDAGVNVAGSAGPVAWSASQTSQPWSFWVIITTRTAGASGLLLAGGSFKLDQSGAPIAQDINGSVTLDTTVSHTVSIGVNLGAASQSITARSLVVYPF